MRKSRPYNCLSSICSFSNMNYIRDVSTQLSSRRCLEWKLNCLLHFDYSFYLSRCNWVAFRLINGELFKTAGWWISWLVFCLLTALLHPAAPPLSTAPLAATTGDSHPFAASPTTPAVAAPFLHLLLRLLRPIALLLHLLLWLLRPLLLRRPRRVLLLWRHAWRTASSPWMPWTTMDYTCLCSHGRSRGELRSDQGSWVEREITAGSQDQAPASPIHCQQARGRRARWWWRSVFFGIF